MGPYRTPASRAASRSPQARGVVYVVVVRPALLQPEGHYVLGTYRWHLWAHVVARLARYTEPGAWINVVSLDLGSDLGAALVGDLRGPARTALLELLRRWPWGVGG